MKVSQLKKYCQENDIFVPSGATKEYLEAAIVRFFLHKKPINLSSCFGFWERDNSACLVCDHVERCKNTSLGINSEKYMKSVDKKADKRIRFR